VIDDALVLSLAARVRELEAIQADMARRLAQATSVAGIIARADGVPRPREGGPVSHRQQRDRHGMHAVEAQAGAALLWTAKGLFVVVKGHKVAAALGLSAAALILALMPVLPIRPAVYVRPALPPGPVPSVVVHHHHRGRRPPRAPRTSSMPRHAPG
jgi:hypothetical protein